MAIYLDDQELDVSAGSLAELLDAARGRLDDGGRVVVEVRLDGEALDQPQLDARLGEPTGDAEVRLYSADPMELCLAALDDARLQLAEVERMQRSAAEQLQADDGGAAFATLGGVIQVWLNVSQAVTQSSELALVDLSALRVEGQPASDVTEELVDQLRSVKVLIESQDSSGLADALAHEWPPVIQRWDALVLALGETIRG